ncbi:MAG: hypothetical protein ACYCS1_08720 [Gammaproteobacteria bacterium]
MKTVPVCGFRPRRVGRSVGKTEMTGSMRTIISFRGRWAACALVVSGLCVMAFAKAEGSAPKALILPLQPCHGLSESCLPVSKPEGWARRRSDPQHPAAPLPIQAPVHRPATAPSKQRLHVQHLRPNTLGLGGLVTPERLLSALAYRTRSGRGGDLCRSKDSAHLCSRVVVLVDGKRWRPDGILGYTRAAIPARWISRVDVMENASDVASQTGHDTGEGDPGIVDVILHRLRISGEASVSAGVLEGGGSYSGSNAEDYNILLDARDRNGDSFLFDFNYERYYGPWWYPPP